MKLGIIARADDRGLGTLTADFAANLQPDRVLVVREPGAERQGFPAHVDRFPHAMVVTFDPKDGTLPEATCRAFLEGLDVTYMAETPYDYRLFGWAADAGCATVLHVMPEFWRWSDPELPRPTVWWLPTSWRQTVLPGECRLVPVPVPTPPDKQRPPTSGMVHVAGHRAAADRNGTLLLFQALRHCRERFALRVECQDPRLPSPGSLRGAKVTHRLGGVPDRWSLYDNAGVLVMPRRYGGLCLPVLEAFARGLAVVMTDVDPQRAWPIMPVAADSRRSFSAPAGPMMLADCRVRDLAVRLDQLAASPDMVEGAQYVVRQWVREHDWTALRPAIIAELQRAAG